MPRQPKLYTCAGKTQSMTQWAHELDVHTDMLRNRLRQGWSHERTFSTPNLRPELARTYIHDGKAYTVSQIAKATGKSYNTIIKRIQHGYPMHLIMSKDRIDIRDSMKVHDRKGAKYHWMRMLAGCEDKHHFAYQKRGAKGFRVCSRWRKFNSFLKDMGEPPPDHYLGFHNRRARIYSLKNCKWVPLRRTVTINGETDSLNNWVKRFELSRKVVADDCIYKRKMTPYDALMMPYKRHADNSDGRDLSSLRRWTTAELTNELNRRSDLVNAGKCELCERTKTVCDGHLCFYRRKLGER